jgi:hypothetical protein
MMAETLPAITDEQFLTLLYRNAFGKPGTLILSTAHRDAGQKPHGWHDSAFDLTRITVERIAAIIRKETPHREVFFACPIYAGTRRQAAQAIAFPFLYAEHDKPPLIDLPPTVSLCTSPGHYHDFYLLDRPLGRDAAIDLNRRIAHATGADPSGADGSQVLRLPETYNHKYPDKPLVTVAVWAPDRVFHPEDFARLPAPDAVYVPHTPGDERIGEGERNVALHALGRAMKFHRAGEGAIHLALSAVNDEQCDPPLDADEVAGIIRSVASPVRGDGGIAESVFFKAALSLRGLGLSDDAIRAAVAKEHHARGVPGRATVIVDAVMDALNHVPRRRQEPGPPPAPSGTYVFRVERRKEEII